MHRINKACLLLALVLAAGVPDFAAAASTNKKISHVVVLMLENRSFDHMLGFLHANNSNVDGCTTERAVSDDACTNPADPTVAGSPRTPVNPDAVMIQPADPNHSYDETLEQVYGYRPVDTSKPAPMDGFIKNYAGVNSNKTGGGEFIMNCFPPVHVPVITTLGSEFAVVDHWFSGIPGPTEVNRAFANSGTSHGYTGNQEIIHNLGMPQRTTWEMVEDSGNDWKVYFEDFPSALLFRYTWLHLDHFHGMPTFVEDAAKGDLPAYSWLEPRYYADFGKEARDQHPDHDVAEGEALIREVYDALRSGPKWNETLLVVTYDEHGGFFDHVPPPVNIPNPDGLNHVNPDFNFTRAGVRVPAIIASPWIPKGTVVHSPESGGEYCHSSIPATLRELFAPDEAHLTHRSAWAATFDQLLTLDEPRTDCPTTLPEPDMHRELFGNLPPLDGQMPLTDLQKFFMQTANLVNGDELLTEEQFAAMNEGDGSKYVINAVNKAAGRTIIKE